MAKLPDQSFEADLPVMRVAHDWTALAVAGQVTDQRLDITCFSHRGCSCLIDTSVWSWAVTDITGRSDEGRLGRDVDAFKALLALGGKRLVQMSLTPSIRDELQRGSFTDDQKKQINLWVKQAGVKLYAEAIRSAVGQRTYGTFDPDPVGGISEVESAVRELLDPAGVNPAVPGEDRRHYLMACLGRTPFVSMDYHLGAVILKALKNQVELVEGRIKGKAVPKQRPPLTAPVVTPSAYLEQLQLHHPVRT